MPLYGPVSGLQVHDDEEIYVTLRRARKAVHTPPLQGAVAGVAAALSIAAPAAQCHHAAEREGSKRAKPKCLRA